MSPIARSAGTLRAMQIRAASGAAALVALVAISYAPAARLGFIYDDYELIVDREPPRSAFEIARVFAERHWPTLPYYRPIPRASMLVQKSLHGNEPAPYHVFNATLVAAIALAAFALLRTGALALPMPLAFAGAALFVLHPVASSCVYPIASGRETLWPTLFELLAVIAWLRPGGRAYALAIGSTAAALLSKEHAVVLPALFVLCDGLGLSADAPRVRLAAWLRRYLPLALLLLGYLVLRRTIFAGEGKLELALAERPWGPLLSLAYALQAVFAPTRDLVYEPVVEVWLSPWRLGAALAASAAIGLALVARGASVRRRALFWLGWILLGLLPTSNLLVQEARFDERYVFFASLGVIALALLAVESARRGRTTRVIVAIALVALIASATAISVWRAQFFASDAAFLARWIESDPARAQPHVSLGKLAARDRDWPASIGHFNDALARTPENADALNGLGLAHEALGQVDQAEQDFRRALEVDPGNGWAHNNLGVLHLSGGQLAAAGSEFEASLAAKGDPTNARINLALVHARRGDRAAAVAELEQVLASRPGHAGACFNLGVLLADAGDDPHALVYLERAIDTRPDYALAHYRLGVVLARLGRPAEAENHLGRALELDASLEPARRALEQLRH